MLRTQKHWLIRRLGDPNPMDDAPDQDSAYTPIALSMKISTSDEGIKISNKLKQDRAPKIVLVHFVVPFGPMGPMDPN